MKPKRTQLFIVISSVALLGVLIIQVNWIWQTAKIKEELFNEKANMVLARTTEALSADSLTRKNMQVCVGDNETHKIDSLFNHYMNFYNFHIGYYFEVKSAAGQELPLTTIASQNQQACYSKSMDELANRNGFELKLIFPGKGKYIMEEMGLLFITSVILVIIVLVMFWRTVSSLMKEKKISEHTTDFLNNMTHEFKTPLTNIALAGKMITKDAVMKQEGKLKHYSEIILSENEKLKLQVEQVLSMTALERGEIPLQKTTLDFHQLLHDATKCMSVQIENENGHLQFKPGANNVAIVGDKTHLTNALCNLIDNAVKYAKEKPDITIETFNRGNNLLVIVADKGIGIEKKHRHQVFDLFFRVPTGDVHDVKGFGLGLAYVKKIIELHGGTIELASEIEKGTTFTILLPNA